MKLAIMQPYFMPYIGYWQLMNAVDTFVVYDNIEYTKKGWINRNRILLNGKVVLFTIPIKKDSDYLDVCDRFIADDFNRKKILNTIKEAYRKAPYYNSVFPIVEEIIMCQELNLFKYIYNSIKIIRNLLGITTEMVISSSINIDHKVKGKDKVISMCREFEASIYINSIGGQLLYNKDEFLRNGVDLYFLKTDFTSYKQFGNDTINGLSILDVLMFNSIGDIKEMLTKYSLV